MDMYSGDSAVISVAVKDADGHVALDLTGATIRAGARHKPTGLLVDAVVVVTSATAGTLTASFARDQINRTGLWLFEVEVEDAAGAVFTVAQDVIRAKRSVYPN